MKNLDLFFTGLLMLFDQLVLKMFISSNITIVSLFIDIIQIVFVLSFISLFKRRRIIEIILIILVTVYCLSQNIYYLFFNSLYSIMNLTTLHELSGVKMDLLSKFRFELLLYFVPLIIYFLFFKYYKNNENSAKLRFVKSTLLCTLCVLFLSSIFNKQSIFAQSVWTKEDMYIYESMINKNEFIDKFGIGTYIKRDIQKAVSKDEIDKNQFDRWLSEHKQNDDANEYTDIFKGKNLIILQSESLSVNAINESLTPNLNKLKNDGLFFSNFYAPLYPANTSDSEFIIQTSLIPSLENSISCYEYGNAHFKETLPLLFKNDGYSVNSYHSFYEEYYNRNVFHRSLGFDNYYGVESLFNEEKKNFQNEYWVDDKKLIETYLNKRRSDRYYDLIISTSGHLPYSEKREQLSENYQKVKDLYPEMDDELCYYYAAQMKYDEGLGVLMNSLGKNDVLVVIGDHYPYGLNEEAQNELLDDSYTKYRTPFIIYSQNIEHKVIDKSCSTFDALPTLANMFGYKLDEYHVGRDIFEDGSCTVYFSDGSIIHNDKYLDSGDEYLEARDIYYYSQEILKSMK